MGTPNTCQPPEDRRDTLGPLEAAYFKSVTISSIATDARGVIQVFNAGAERMLGYAAADVVGKITPADLSEPEELIARAMSLSAELGTSIAPGFEALAFKASRGIEDVYDLTFFRNDGSRLPARVSVTALRDARDMILGYLLIGTDDTARKRLEAEREKLDQLVRSQEVALRRKDTELETANRMNAEILANLPRELGSPARPVALVVEDDDKAAALIRVQLEAEGFRVLGAASAESALLLAVQQPLSLITLDILLPEMDGWEFLARIRQEPALQRVPVVIVSIAPDGRKGFSLGATAVMQKPVTRQELHDALVDLGLAPIAEGRALTVLVVDDDPRAVELIAARIAGLASNVLRAYGGREAIAAARREIPDLIVLDLVMPKVNGFDVVEALHDTPETAQIPILVVTGKEITADDRARLNGCVTTIVEKAVFNPGRFTAEVRRALSGRQAAVRDRTTNSAGFSWGTENRARLESPTPR